jgi:hypothetical protein
MQIVIGIICFLIFLFVIYILGKDDYFLIKKNFFMENLFDVVFSGVLTGFILSRFFSMFINLLDEKSLLFGLRQSKNEILTLTYSVLGGFLAFYLIGKYKRIPLERFFDFIAFAFLACLPVWYLLNALFVKRSDLVYFIVPGILYLVSFLFFWKIVLHKILSGGLKIGYLSVAFFLVYSIISIFVSIYKEGSLRVSTVEEVLLIIVFVISILFNLRLIKRRGLRRRL